MIKRTQKKKSDIKKPGRDSDSSIAASREKDLRIISEDDLILVTGGARAKRNVADQA